MNEPVVILLTIWLMLAGVVMAVAAYILCADPSDRGAARTLFLSPLWPVLLIWHGSRGLARAWRTADWRGRIDA